MLSIIHNLLQSSSHLSLLQCSPLSHSSPSRCSRVPTLCGSWIFFLFTLFCFRCSVLLTLNPQCTLILFYTVLPIQTVVQYSPALTMFYNVLLNLHCSRRFLNLQCSPYSHRFTSSSPVMLFENVPHIHTVLQCFKECLLYVVLEYSSHLHCSNLSILYHLF